MHLQITGSVFRFAGFNLIAVSCFEVRLHAHFYGILSKFNLSHHSIIVNISLKYLHISIWEYSRATKMQLGKETNKLHWKSSAFTCSEYTQAFTWPEYTHPNVQISKNNTQSEYIFINHFSNPRYSLFCRMPVIILIVFIKVLVY